MQAAIAGDKADRAPVALWRHFPVDDQDPAQLARSIIAFQQAHDFDFVKVTPASSYCLRDWGVHDEWRGNYEGTRDYLVFGVEKPSDWRALPVLDPGHGSLKAQLDCLELLQAAFGRETPYIETIFSPLSQAKNLVGKANLFEHMNRDPESVEAGLKTITESTIAYIQAAQERGIAGIFYAVQHASYKYFDEAGYTRFGEAYDQRVLEAAQGMWLNALHLHGEQLMFGLAGRLPVEVVNWHDREAGPSLAEGRGAVRGAVCGGLRRWDTMVLGTPESVGAEAGEALAALGGRGVVLGTGCVVPMIAPRANIQAARDAVDCV